MGKRIRGSIFLLIAALIWGSAFVAQSVAMDHIGPFSYQTVRSFTASIFLILLAFGNDGIARIRGAYKKPEKAQTKRLLIGGIICGLALSGASNLQQFGIKYTTVGKAGFLTALYILFVPILGLIFFKKKPSAKVWCGIALAVVGLYMLCMSGSFALALGDAVILLCSVVFAVHIICCDKFAPGADILRLSAIQFFVVGVVSAILMLIFEPGGLKDVTANISNVWFPILYAAIMSSGIAYTLQIFGQRDVPPTVASLLMSLESVFAVLSGMVLLKEIPSLREAIGCVLMFAAVILAQLPDKVKK